MALSTFDLGSFIPYVSASVRARLEKKRALEQLFVDEFDFNELVDEATQRALLIADELSQAIGDELEPIVVLRFSVRRAVEKVMNRSWIADRPIKSSKARHADCDMEALQHESAPSVEMCEHVLNEFVADFAEWKVSPEVCDKLGAELAAWRMRHEAGALTIDIGDRLGKSTRDVCAMISKAQRAVERFADEWMAERIR